MDFSAPSVGQVRHTLVGGGEIPVLNTLQNSEHQSPSKGMNTNDNNAKPPTLTQRRDGSYRLLYSTKTDIAYKCHRERQWSTSEMNPAAKDFDMFGLKRSEWQQLLSCDATIRAALSYDAETEMEQRMYQLNQVRKSELMYALRNLEDPDYQQGICKGKLYCDYLTVQISDGVGTINEQTAICAAVSLTNIKCIREEDSMDLGYGIFQLSRPRKIAILPGFDPAKP